MHVMRLLQAGAIGLSSIVLVAPIQGQSLKIYVDAGAMGAGNGTKWTDAFTEIQVAINEAANQGQNNIVDILVAKGTYYGTEEWTGGCPSNSRYKAIILKAPALPNSEVRIHGGFDGGATGSTNPDDPEGPFNQTILTGDPADPIGPYHVIVADGAIMGASRKVTLDGFKVSGGLADGGGTCYTGNGGGMLVLEDARVLVENVTFKDNCAELGGGAVSVWPDLIDNYTFDCKLSKFRSNTAKWGGAVHLGGRARFCNVLFRENGTFLQPVQPGVPNTVAGGAMHIDESPFVSITNSVFYDNVAQEGMAAYVLSSSVGNSTTHLWQHSTIAYNSSGQVPTGGAAVYLSPGPQGTETFDNCILWGNGWADLWHDGTAGSQVALTLRGVDLGNWTSTLGLWSGLGIISANPNFRNPAARDLRLSGVSPCIDAGLDLYLAIDRLDVDGNKDDMELLPIDLAGDPRSVDYLPGGSVVDLGAFESAAPNQ